MGVGVLWLLRGVERSGSLRAAAEEMDLSYAKAHRMIREAERGLGVTLLHRRRGGDERRGAALTPEARYVTDAYERLHSRIKSDAMTRFRDFLSEVGPRLGLRAGPGG
jgi:molybdate transport system regulatory protein